MCVCMCIVGRWFAHRTQALPRLHLSSAADDKRIVSYLHIHLFSNVLHRRRRVNFGRPMYLLIVGSHYCFMYFAYALHMRQQNLVLLSRLYTEPFELVIQIVFHYCTTPSCHKNQTSIPGQCLMVNCIVPVLADNPRAYNLVLVSLYICVCVCVRVHLCVCVCVYVHIHTHTYIYICMYIVGIS